MSKRRSSRGKVVCIDVSDIKYDSACRDIVPGGLPFTVACDIYKPQLDIHIKRSNKPDKKDKSIHQINVNNIGFLNGVKIIR